MVDIYKASFPNGKCYIGISVEGLEVRKRRHYRDAPTSKKIFHRALLKYETVIWEILEQVETWEEACLKEKEYVSKFDSYNNGYNMTLGGDGSFGFKHDEETKKRMSQLKQGYKPSEYNRQCRMKVWQKPVICYDKQGNKVKEFGSIKEAYQWLGRLGGNISLCCQNKPGVKSAYGYVWRYKEVTQHD